MGSQLLTRWNKSQSNPLQKHASGVERAHDRVTCISVQFVKDVLEMAKVVEAEGGGIRRLSSSTLEVGRSDLIHIHP